MLNKKISLVLIWGMVLVFSAALAAPSRAVVVPSIPFPTSPACTASGGVMGDLNHDSLINTYDRDAIQEITKGNDIYNPCGDFSNDGMIGPDDVSLIKTLINNLNTGATISPLTDLWDNSFYNPYRLPPCQTIYGDVNGDLKANYQDVDINRQIILGILPTNQCADSDRDGIISPGDISMLTATVKTGVAPLDFIRPIITLIGANKITMQVNTPYAELGATASDNIDGDLTASIVIDSSALNTSVVGVYVITYNVTDSDTNKAIQMQREVTVVDTTSPVITLVGVNPQVIVRGNPYVELGATALDNYDGDISAAIVIDSSAVNTGVAGTYIVTYDVTDANGNAAIQVSRTVKIISTGSGGGDVTPPTNLSLLINNDANISDNINVILTIGATDASQMVISNTSGFDLAQWEPFVTTKAWQLTEGAGRKVVYAKFRDSSGNLSATISDEITLVPEVVPVAEPEEVIIEDGLIPEEETGEVLGEKIIDPRELQLLQIYDDARYIWPGDTNLLLGYMNLQRNLVLESSMNQKYLSMLIGEFRMASLDTANQTAVTNFLTYGTKTTLALGAGERAGVLNSYKSAYGNLPKTEENWRDAIKIANGRFPSQISRPAEDRANINFKRVYLRNAVMTNPNDSAAINTMAYGMRPLPRNLNSEKAGIKIFKGIYGYYPSKATAWDVVRAISYSGATR